MQVTYYYEGKKNMDKIIRLLREDKQFRAMMRAHTSFWCVILSVVAIKIFPQIGWEIFLTIGIVAIIATNIVISNWSKTK